MQQSFPSKGAKPVPGPVMLNFLYWLSTYYPAIKNLQRLQDATVLQLVHEFEMNRPDFPSFDSRDWFKGIDLLYSGSKDDSYREAIAFARRLK